MYGIRFMIHARQKILLQYDNDTHIQNVYMIISDATWHLKSLATQLFVQQLGHTGPLWGESTRDRWIPLTKDSNTGSVSCYVIMRMIYQVIFFSSHPIHLFKEASNQGLTHWGPDKMGDILQMTFSSGFSWTKMFEYLLKFHWSLFLMVQLT